MFISKSKEDLNLLSRADDTVSLAEIRNKPCFLGFLNEREIHIIKDHLSWNKDNMYFYGGYDGAKRQVLCCYGHEINFENFPVKAIYFKFRKADVLCHRDFLGALMALGIERDCVGDILVGEGFAVCYVKSEIYDFITSQLSKIGHVGVSVIDKENCKISFEQNTELISLTISSLRLDVIVAAITGLSRTKTTEFILSGKVIVNYQECQNFSYKANVGDILAVRGSGKYIIKEITGLTKKGRLKIVIEHFR